MSEFSNHENTDGSRPPVEGIPVVPVEPSIDAPTVVAAVAAAEGLPLRTLTTEPGTLERDEELARWAADDAAQTASRVAPDPVVESRPCVAAASTSWPGPETCRQRWPGIPRGWCAACLAAPDVEVGAGFVRVGGTVYPRGPFGEWTVGDGDVAPPVEPIPSYGELVASRLELEPDEDRRRLLSLFPDRATDGTLHHAVLMAVEEITRLRGGDERPLQSEAIELLALTADYPQGHPLREAAGRLATRLARAEARAWRHGSTGVTVPAEDLDHTPGSRPCDGCPTGEGHNR